MYLVLPIEETPHARIATENESWFLTEAGELGRKETNHFSELLLELHLYLHLPNTLGMILVSAFGAVLVGLIISGFLAHPGLFRDAFRFRQRSSTQLSETDLHNRLSVWGAPFHLTIAITGAYFGLALPLLAIVAETKFDGDRDQVVEMVFGAEPELEPVEGYIEINRAIEHIRSVEPTAIPLNVIVHDANTQTPMLEIYARHPERMIWGEGYQFTIKGEFIKKAGWSDGAIGQQVLYSIYRLHFGTFGGYLSKALYFILGMALTVVAATGTNIWLAKRRKEDGLDDLWTGLVWGTPIAICVTAKFAFLSDQWLTTVFWLSLIASTGLCLYLRNTWLARRSLKIILAASIAILVLVHWLVFASNSYSSGALIVNAFLIVMVIVLVASRDVHQQMTRHTISKDGQAII